MEEPSQLVDTQVLESDDFQHLLDCLIDKGYLPVGPTVRDGVIVYDRLTTTSDLPIGWTDKQDAGAYRLEKREDKGLFGYSVGPHSWKQFLQPSSLIPWGTRRKGDGYNAFSGNGDVPHFAIIGARPCDLRAIAIQDEIFLNGAYRDRKYQSIRESAIIVAVNCRQPGGSCFCASMNTGPRAESGYDLVLTEVINEERHYFLVEVATEVGVEILDGVPTQIACNEEIQLAEQVIEYAAREIQNIADLKKLLYDNYEHQQWDDVAERCLDCGICTIVCPTCFCNTMEDLTDLKVETAETKRKSDSCYTVDFGFTHGGSTRVNPRTRYRQWLTRKLITWQDQFDTIGCVGCGRCITWCPAGIDITEEVRAIQYIKPVCKVSIPGRERSFETMRRLLLEHSLVRGIGDEYIDLITECSSIVRFNPGEYIIHSGEDADRFYLIRHGNVAIETYAPEQGSSVVQTIGEGEMLGWSWFIQPYRWHFNAQAVDLTRAIAVEARRLREACEKDAHLGYIINRYISQVIGQRMEATRMQLLDVYKDRA